MKIMQKMRPAAGAAAPKADAGAAAMMEQATGAKPH